VKVLDFGIAKLHSSPSKISTQTGAVMGTPVYMSPEQCRGAREEVDERTDVYSLGIILYEMLCGRPPFQGQAFGDLLLRHMTEEPAPPSSHNSEVSEELEAVVLRALAKRREDRYESMRALQVGLSAAIDGLRDKTPAPFDVRRLAAPRTLTPPVATRTPVTDGLVGRAPPRLDGGWRGGGGGDRRIPRVPDERPAGHGAGPGTVPHRHHPGRAAAGAARARRRGRYRR
jgi:serine/threonine-protein kinase